MSLPFADAGRADGIAENPKRISLEQIQSKIYGICGGIAASVGLDIHTPDHLAPLFSFGCHVRTELPRTELQWQGGRLRNSCLDCRICQAGVNFGIEPLNNFRRHTLS